MQITQDAKEVSSKNKLVWSRSNQGRTWSSTLQYRFSVRPTECNTFLLSVHTPSYERLGFGFFQSVAEARKRAQWIAGSDQEFVSKTHQS